MPQKKTVRKSSAKASGKNTKKRTSRRTTKKPKVYIPAYKAIILCCVIITICMGLLLITTIKEPDKRLSDAVIEKYKEEIVDSKNEAENQKQEELKPAKKTETAKKSDTEKKAQSQSQSQSQSQPQTTSSKPEKKIETPQAAKESSDSSKKAPAKAEKTAQTEGSQNTKPAPVIETPKEKYNFPAAKNNAQLIFVFDDGGQNLSQLSPFLKLPFPITVAVLPQLAHSREAANQIRASGNEVILHQPMQAVNAAVNPGPGAIKPDMTESQIISTLFQNITELGPIAGMNNHEGSAITADAEKMAVVMKMCSQEGIYFLDSRTNSETQVPYVAQALGYSWYERNIFLDNEKTNANALKELKKGLDLANKNGSVIMIGHIWSADFLPAFLQDVYPELKAKGYTFSLVSKSRAKKS